MKSVRDEIDDLKLERARLRAEQDELRTELATIEQSRCDQAANIEQIVRERAALLVAASELLDTNVQALLARTDEDVIGAVFAKHAPGVRLDGQSPEYQRARFDELRQDLREGRQDAAHRQLGAAMVPPSGPEQPANKLDAAHAAVAEETRRASQAGPPQTALTRVRPN